MKDGQRLCGTWRVALPTHQLHVVREAGHQQVLEVVDQEDPGRHLQEKVEVHQVDQEVPTQMEHSQTPPGPSAEGSKLHLPTQQTKAISTIDSGSTASSNVWRCSCRELQDSMKILWFPHHVTIHGCDSSGTPSGGSRCTSGCQW